MTELRLYLRRDSLRDGNDCNWVLLTSPTLAVAASGASLENLPKAGHCRLVLAPELVTLAPVNLPDLPERKLQPLLASAAEGVSLSEAEQLHAALLQRDESGIAWLAVVDKAWFKHLLGQLKARGIQPDAALPESLLLPWQKNTWSVLWNEEGAIARFAEASADAFDRSEPPAGLGLALRQAAAPSNIQVWQGTALHPANTQIWANALGVPVQAAGSWNWRNAAWPTLSANLLQGMFAPARTRIDWRSALPALAMGVAALVGIQIAGAGVDTLLLSNEQRTLQKKIHDLAEKALPAHAAIVDPAWQVSEQLKQSRVRQDRSPDSFTSLSNLLGKAWPNSGGGKVQSVVYEAGRLTVTLESPDSSGLDQLENSLRSAGLDVEILRPDKAAGQVQISMGTLAKRVNSQ